MTTTAELKRKIISASWKARAGALRRMGIVGVYWWKGQVNFGDLITPDLLAFFGCRFRYVPKEYAMLFAVGSILHNIPEDSNAAVWGSGFREPGGIRKLPRARIYAVRGPMSASRLPGHNVKIFGDPGLLISELLPRQHRPRYAFGLVPHWKEKRHPAISALVNKLGSDLLLIDPQRSPDDVARDITSCGFILSTSLHGIIVAHSYEIPAVWLKLSGGAIAGVPGGEYKFEDYYGSFDQVPDPVMVSGQHIEEIRGKGWCPERAVLDRKRKALGEAFDHFISDQRGGM